MLHKLIGKIIFGFANCCFAITRALRSLSGGR